MSFKLLKLNIYLEALDVIELPPYKGSVLRGAFGNTFRKTVCVAKSPTCSSCILMDKCVYSYAFETPLVEKSEIFKNYSNVPHPFVLDPPVDSTLIYRPGKIFRMGLTLIGDDAIDRLSFFLFAIIKMGDMGIGRLRGKFRMISAITVDCNDNEAEIVYENGELKSFSTFLTIDHAMKKASEFNSDRITLDFITPLRIKHKGRLINKPEFDILFRNALRRLTSLAYFHCGIEKPSFYDDVKLADNVTIQENKTYWQDWSRYSARQKTRMKLGGLMGEVTYKGKKEDINKLKPYIILCSWINLGKGTVFGLGKINFF